MKYVLMFTSHTDMSDGGDTEQTQAALQAGLRVVPGARRGRHARRQRRRAAPGHTATTVKYGDDGPVVVDGPFNEAKEIIGGFTVLDVPDMDAAIAITKSWPMLDLPGVAVEIRPMVEDYSQFE